MVQLQREPSAALGIQVYTFEIPAAQTLYHDWVGFLGSSVQSWGKCSCYLKLAVLVTGSQTPADTRIEGKKSSWLVIIELRLEGRVVEFKL